MLQKKYREEFEKNKGKLIPIEETSEMKLSKELHPIQSQKTYSDKSKEMLKNVKIGQGKKLPRLLLAGFKCM